MPSPKLTATEQLLASNTLSAPEHWRLLASQERERLNWDKTAHPSVVHSKADMYDKAAQAIELSDSTGVPHCSCHLIPMKACAERRMKK